MVLSGTHAALLDEPVPEDDAIKDVPPVLLLLVLLAPMVLLESTVEDAVDVPVDVDVPPLLDPAITDEDPATADEDPAITDEDPAITDEAPTDEDTTTDEDRTRLLELPANREDDPTADDAAPPLVDDDDDDALEPLSDGLVHPNPTATNTTNPPDPRQTRMRLLQPCGPACAGVCAGNITLAHQTRQARAGAGCALPDGAHLLTARTPGKRRMNKHLRGMIPAPTSPSPRGAWG